ncbi:MAG: hypothetical protein ACKVH8_22280, partial [Pirellulales bacterium]
VTDEELREFIAECKRIADEKEIPDENFIIDLTAELKKAIDNVLLDPIDVEPVDIAPVTEVPALE